MIAKEYVCDDCGARCEFTGYVKARRAGWAVSKDYKKCYCTACAPDHRNGGANKERHNVVGGFEQLVLDLK